MAVVSHEAGLARAQGRDIRTSVWVFALLALATAALWPTVLAMIRIWGEMADYQHGYAIAVVTVIWLVRARSKIDHAPSRRSLPALLALLVVLFVWLVALRANSEMLQQLLLPVVLLLTVTAACGTRVAAAVTAPLGYLYFAIPAWEYLVPLLQKCTVAAVENALGILHVPASFAGIEVTIPSGKFSITEDCSGKRYLIVGLASATLLGTMQRLSSQRLAVLLVGTVVLSMVANWVRVAIIIYLGHVTEMRHYLVAVEHATFGWALFVPLLTAIVGLSALLGHSATASVARAPYSGAVAITAGAARPQIALLLIAFAVTTIPPGAPRVEPSLAMLPVLTGAWQGPFPSDSSWNPRFMQPLAQRQASFRSDSATVHVYVNLYESQRQGRELVHYQNSVLGEGWSQMTLDRESHQAGGPIAGDLRLARDGSGRLWVLMQMYNIDGALTSRPLVAQLSYGAQALLRPVPSGVIALTSPCQSGGCESAASAIAALWKESGDEFVRMISAQR